MLWLYAQGEYERHLLHRLVTEALAAGRTVHYAQNFARPAETVRFRHAVSGTRHERGHGELPALRVSDPRGWEADAGAGWRPVQVRRGTDIPPHLLDEPSVTLRPQEIEPGLFDVGATVLGHIECVVAGEVEPMIRTGESRAEALSPETPETRHDLVGTGAARRSAHRVGFRYLRAEGVREVRVEATIRPATAPGAFSCSDETLNRIWSTAAYTTRLCQQGLSLDGVKRDRLPWAGDQALALLTNAFTLSDIETAADTLTALGNPVEGYVNGLADYSMWWLIAQHEMRQYFGDRFIVSGLASGISGDGAADVEAGLARRATAIDEFLSQVSLDVAADGVLRPRDLGSFAGSGPVLIDWGVNASRGEELTALQVLFVWALSAATSLLTEASHPGAARWAAMHDRALATLWEQGWDAEAGAWRSRLGGRDTRSPYPQLLAVLAGLHEDEMPRSVVDRIDLTLIRTPFMTGFALRALDRAGRGTEALALMRSRWAPMLAAGATTFWEEFANDGESPYGMYGRPFGKSLCHGWGAAPAALLPEIALGLRPLDPGWRTVQVNPQLGDLEWAAAVVPTPHGDLVVTASRNGLHIEAPPGIRVLSPDGAICHVTGASAASTASALRG